MKTKQSESEIDPIVATGLDKLSDVRREVIITMYDLRGKTQKTVAEVATILNIPTVDIELHKARAIATLGEDCFRRLYAIVTGEEVESAESIQQAKHEARNKNTIRQGILASFSVNNSMTAHQAKQLWNTLSDELKELIHAKFVLHLSNEKIANQSSTPITGKGITARYNRLLNKHRMRTQHEAIEAMMAHHASFKEQSNGGSGGD